MDLKHERRLTEVEDRAKSNSHRLDEVERRQSDLEELVGSVKVLATKQEAVEADVKEIKSDVKNLTSKPGKRWEIVIEKIITVVVGAIVLFLLAKFGL